MKAIVTGAAGFIGHTLAKRLVSDGYDVVGVDCFTDYYDVGIKKKNLESIGAGRFELVEADLRYDDIAHIFDEADFVFHQAGQPGVRKSWGTDFLEYTEMNVNVTQRILEHCLKLKNLKSFVYASSSSIYGNADKYPTNELVRPKPVSPYGVTKLAAEHLCSLYAQNFGLPVVSLRYFTVYGPGQRPDMAFTRFLRAAVRDEQITIFGDGTQIRDFTYVDDIVQANISCATANLPPGSIFNVAGGSNISVNAVLEQIENLNRRSLRIEYIDSIAGDVIRTGGLIDAIRDSTGWHPEVDLETGLALQLDWARSIFA